ncbi:MAG: trypsin-like peptidase domain-containing protein, partial [Armatimonadota bacterium]
SQDVPDLFRGWPFGDSGPQNPRSRPQTRQVGGSGVVVRADGYILTNDHVVGGTENVEVKLKDGRKFPGKVFRDYATDLAVIKINATNLPTAKLADSGIVKAGNWAIAIGSPFGLSNTLTVGVVSALERENYIPDSDSGSRGGRYYASLIQTDAAINPGNSGGPLLNLDGEVIGINVMIESPTGASAGIGFAIPSNTAKWVMDQLVTKGKVERGFLGLTPDDLEPTAAAQYGIEHGALVVQVIDGKPAATAGIQVEDVIVSIGGKPVNSALDLREIIAKTAPGTKIPVVVVRDKKKQTLSVTVDSFPDQIASGNTTDTSPAGELGITVRSLSQELRDQYNIDSSVKGVVITGVDPGSPAAGSGMQPGDVILRVDGQPTTTAQQYQNAVKGIKAGDSSVFVVRRKDGTTRVEITVPRE